MPIARHKINSTPKTKPNVPKVEPKEYKSIIHDDRVTPINSLVAYIEGASWTVDYYSQVVSEHNDLREIDPGQSGVFQQYQKILGYELRVSTALTSNYDAETGISTVSGNANIYPGLIPNISDYFVTDTNYNKKAIFRLTNVERKTFNFESTYYIEYELVGYIDTLQTLYSDLEEKSIRTYHFSKERLIDGFQPLVKEEEYQEIQNLAKAYYSLLRYYFNTFYNPRYNTIVLPGQESVIYDSMLVSYLSSIITTEDDSHMLNMRVLPTNNEPYLNQPNIWSAFRNRDYSEISYVNKEMGLVNKKVFDKNTFIKSIAFYNIDYLIYPKVTDNTALTLKDKEPHLLLDDDIIQTVSYDKKLLNLISNTYIHDTVSYNIIKDVSITPYVLSLDFYNNTENKSLFEICVKDYLERKTVNLKQLSVLIHNFKKWPRLEQFYYGPMLLSIIKSTNRELYT